MNTLTDALARLAKASYEQGYRHGTEAAQSQRVTSGVDEDAQQRVIGPDGAGPVRLRVRADPASPVSPDDAR